MTLDASTRPTPSPIVRVLNEEVRHYHRWCTPSTRAILTALRLMAPWRNAVPA